MTKDGQLTIWDVVDPEPEPPKGDCSTCQHEYWLHPAKGGTPVRGTCVTCEYEPKKCCDTCAYYRMTCNAYTCEPLGIKACFLYKAWSNNLNLKPDKGCEFWEDKTE